MTKDSVADWDTNPSNNTDIAGINITGAGFVSGFDGALREMMAQIAAYSDTAQDSVANRTELKAADTSKLSLLYLKEAGREGVFKWTTGNFSTEIAADTLEGVYVKANAIVASAGAWVRQHDGELPVEWFGAAYNGSDDSAAIETAAAVSLLSGSSIRLTLGRTYTVSTLTLPGGLSVVGCGALRHDGTTVAGDVISIGANSNIENLIYSTPTHGNGMWDVRIGTGTRIAYLETIADAQAQGETVATTGDNVWIGFHRAENMDRPLHVDNSAGVSLTEGFTLGGYDYTSYMRGIRLSATRFYNIGRGVMRGRSANAIDESAGYNSILLASAPDGTIAGGVWEDAGEHAFRIGGNVGPGAVETARVTVGDLLIRKCSGSAIKINPNYTGRAKAIHFVSVVGVDVGYTTGVTAKRSDGLRLSHCEDISFGTVDFVADELATSAEWALRLNNAKNIVIGHLGAKFVESGLVAIDETADVASGQGATQGGDVIGVHINSLVGIKGSATTYPFSFVLPNHSIGDVRISMDVTGLTTGLIAFNATTTLSDIVEFSGRVTTSATATVSNPPASDNFRYRNFSVNGATYSGPVRQVQSNTATLTIGSEPFTLAASTQLGAVFAQTQTGTAALGSYSTGYMASRAGSSGRRGVGWVGKQTGASSQNMGFAVVLNAGVGGNDIFMDGFIVNHDKSISHYPPASVTPTVNGEMTIQLTSDTSLAIKVKGSDGVVRTATLALA
ncbi:hypothetical protein CN204_04165 [Sinorhizobium meliloti]|uniref:hypothetical protein n=1 Tax=Rhizobium meliloti TaxID=382 RepID=UPI000FDBB691|nr:hypothetical protein [Sinorhizobium meliloti]RVH87734.1 hypothetical protein CN204_04165 [Sinorhizobium meliloti]